MLRHSLVWAALFGVMAIMFMQLPQMAARQDALFNSYGALIEVDALAHQEFVEPIVGDRLVHGAIRGMMSQLDPYSGYIAPDELPAFQRRSRGAYIGVGIEIARRDGRLTVIAPIEGGPAARAGVLAGDTILAIDSRDVDHLPVFDAEEWLAGEPGTTLRLRLQRRGVIEPQVVAIQRGPVHVPTVRGFRRDADQTWEHLIDPEYGIGYVRISHFFDNTVRDFTAVLEDLLAKGLRGLVIDLRFNPGGKMDQAIAMVDRFIAEGLILETVTKRRARQQYRASAPGTVKEIPLAVLVNAGSASSAEIVAGSLQAHGRAVIVGERSFGKGSVQHLLALQAHGGAIKLTTAYYRLPDGRIIHRSPGHTPSDSWGVVPDVEIKLTDEEVRAIQHARRLLDSLAGNVDEPAATNPAKRPEVLRDRQLDEALARLRHPPPAARGE